MKKRLLMLHGYSQNSEIFKDKTRHFRQKLESNFEFLYLNAPIKLQFEEDQDQDQDFKLRTWFAEPDQLNETIEYLTSQLGETPIHGIVGFSQGAALANYLAGQRSLPFLVDLQFTIAVSGYSLPNQNTIDCPLLIIFGEFDTVISKEKTLKTTQYAPKSETLGYSTGHVFPTNSKIISQMEQFCNQFV